MSGETPPTAEPMLSAGWIGKHHGLDGTFHVTRPRGPLLTAGTRVTVDGVERKIVHRGGTDARPLLRLDGIDHISMVETLRGKDLFVPRSALPPLEDDEFWPDELVGLPVRSTGGAPVGEVVGVLVLPSCDVLEVRRAGAPDLLVPMHRDAVPELDQKTGRIVVDLAFMGEDEPADTDGGSASPPGDEG
ncbi:MAG: 16S rRNA processing protein RimM [Patulibacter sp.]|nr:16S rRNA processing protein RimM [Patulibacter sp.]